MRRTAFLLGVCLLSTVFASCKARGIVAAVAHNVSSHTLTDVAKTAAEAKYTPPADGYLTGKQIENFIEIRKRAKVIENVAHRELEERAKKSDGKQPSLTDYMQASRAVGILASADIRASQELGLNSAEYEWVKQQMIDASQAAISDQGLIAGKKLAADNRADLQKHFDDAPDEESKKIYGGMIADSEKSEKDAEAAVEPQTPAVVYNKVLLAKYEDASRPMMELILSGTGHEDEIQKALTDAKNAMTGAPKTP
ncbi:MAG: hypothetical protein ACXVJT_01830 [Thermoanaerobaculia bacterium]